MRPANSIWSTFARAVTICPVLVQLTFGPYLSGCAGSEDEADDGLVTQLVAVDPTRSAIGRVTSMGNGLARTFLEYDALGRVAADERVLDGASYVSRRTFGYSQGSVAGPGNVAITERLPDGELVRFAYGPGGVETARYATAPGAAEQALVTGLVRNARGQTTELQTGDGWVTTYCYNDSTDLRLRQIKTGHWTAGVNKCTAAATSILQAYEYAFDGANNVTEVRDYCDIGHCCDPATASCLPGPLSSSFGYDARNRLTSTSTDTDGNGANETYSYAYNAIGNLTNKRGKVQAYTGSKPHALTSSGAVTFSYDQNGNLTSATDGTSIAWDVHNMATRITRGGVTTENSFVGTERWKKVEAGVTSYYLAGLVVEAGRHRKYFGQLAERDPDDTSCGIAAGCLKYHHKDHLGSSTLVTGHGGAVVRRAAYWPYGEKRATAGAFDPRYEFTFQEEEGTGLYNYGARYYNPATGRFVSVDQVAVDPMDPQGLDRYAYARNNPLVYVDPTGTTFEIAALIWGLVAVAASTAISMIPIKELRIMLSVGMGLITGAPWMGSRWASHLLGRIVQATINAAGQISPKAGRILGIATGLIGVVTYNPSYTTPPTFFTATQDPKNQPQCSGRCPSDDPSEIYDVLMQKEERRRKEMIGTGGKISMQLMELLPGWLIIKLGLSKDERRFMGIEEPTNTEVGLEVAGIVFPEAKFFRIITWTGKKVLTKLRRHAQHAREAAMRMGRPRPGNSIDAIKEFVTEAVETGELRIGRYGELDVQMSRLGDLLVLRRFDGSYITHLDLGLDRGNALKRWNEAIPVE